MSSTYSIKRPTTLNTGAVPVRGTKPWAGLAMAGLMAVWFTHWSHALCDSGYASIFNHNRRLAAKSNGCAGQFLTRQHDAKMQSLPVGCDGRAYPALMQNEIRLTSQKSRPNASATVHWLNETDSHYYPLRHTPRSTPVARLSFADADQSDFYIAPDSGRISLFANRHDSAQRWLYHARHRRDIAPLVAQPWARDLSIVMLCLLGEALTLNGCMLGWRRTPRGRGGEGRRSAMTAVGPDAQSDCDPPLTCRSTLSGCERQQREIHRPFRNQKRMVSFSDQSTTQNKYW